VVEDVELMGKDFVPESQDIYLLSSFMGSKQWATEQFADSLTIAADLGSPTFFITITCNSDWSEIKFCLCPGHNFSDIPFYVVRVFKQELTLLKQSLKTMFPHASHMQYLIHLIEFQKRGLPHVHIFCKFEHELIQMTRN
jgi:hypothetical protein